MVFRLAATQNWLLAVTVAVFALPMAMLVGAAFVPPPGQEALAATAGFMLAVYALVWFVFRPTRFEIDRTTLRIVWPTRTRTIRREDVVNVERVTAAAFRSRFGYGIRIGAGGLWGAFGLLKTSGTTFSMWISRTDEFVLVNLRGDRPLLVTPENPKEFIESLGAR